MGGIFGGGGGSAPAPMAPPAPPPPAPTINQAATRVAANRAAGDSALRKRGVAASVLSGYGGASDSQSTATKKTLIGS